MRALLILILLLTVGASSYLDNRRQAFRRPAAAGGSAGLTSPNYDETFEGTGYALAGWSEAAGGGTIDEDYTGVVGAGAQSLRMVQAAFDACYISRTVTANGSYLFYWMVRPVTLGGDDEHMSIWSGGGSTKELAILLLSSGKFRIDLQDASTVDTVGAMSVGTWYHVYISYVNSGKTATVAFSTDGSRPTSGDNFATDTTTGDSDTIDTIGTFGHMAFNAASETIIDNWQAKQGTSW